MPIERREIQIGGWTPNMVRNGCTTKRPYATMPDAIREMHRIGRADPVNRPLLNVYECGHCGRFHIGRTAAPR